MDPMEASLEEFRALRAEQLSHMSAQGAILGLALTGIGALSALAVGVKDGAGRPEYLLILPILLNGLGLAYMGHTDVMRTIGRYVESELWPFLTSSQEPRSPATAAPSWETFIRTTNPPFIARWNVKVMWLLNSIPGGMIFGLPTVAALLINVNAAVSDPWQIAIAWWLGLLASLATLWISVMAATRNAAEDRKLAPARAARESA